MKKKSLDNPMGFKLNPLLEAIKGANFSATKSFSNHPKKDKDARTGAKEPSKDVLQSSEEQNKVSGEHKSSSFNLQETQSTALNQSLSDIPTANSPQPADSLKAHRPVVKTKISKKKASSDKPGDTQRAEPAALLVSDNSENLGSAELIEASPSDPAVEVTNIGLTPEEQEKETSQKVFLVRKSQIHEIGEDYLLLDKTPWGEIRIKGPQTVKKDSFIVKSKEPLGVVNGQEFFDIRVLTKEELLKHLGVDEIAKIGYTETALKIDFNQQLQS